MSLATRDQFLSANKRRFRDVTLPISGVTVRVRSLTELEKSEFEQANYDKSGNRIRGRLIDSKARLIWLCLVDENGEQLLAPGDEQSILEMDSADTGFLWDVLWDHVGFGTQKVDDAAKN